MSSLLPEQSIGDVRLEENFVPDDLAVIERSDSTRPVDVGVWTDEVETSLRYVRVDPITAPADRAIVSLPEIDAFDFEIAPNIQNSAFEGIEDAVRLYKEYRYGRGRVGVLTIDDLSHTERETLPFRQKLWERILAPVSGARAESDRWGSTVSKFTDNSIYTLLKEGLSSQLGLWFIVALVAIYLTIIGPCVYFFLFQYLIVLVVFPAFTATAFTAERARRSLDLLIASDFRPSEIVFGKFVATSLYCLITVFATIPLLALSTLFGGVKIIEIFVAYGILMGVTMLISMVGIFFSSVFAASTRSTIAVSGLVVLALVFSAHVYNPSMLDSSASGEGLAGLAQQQGNTLVGQVIDWAQGDTGTVLALPLF